MNGSFILRVGLAFVFGYFAVSQFIDAEVFTGYLPAALQGANAALYVYANAVIDSLLAIAILFSIFPRVAPALGCVHIALIALSIGFNEIGVRDIGLSLACLALVFIHEEHVPLSARRILARITGKH